MDNNPQLINLAKEHGWRRESNGTYRGKCPVKDHKTNNTLPLVVSSGRSHSIIAYCHACKGNRDAILEALGIFVNSSIPSPRLENAFPNAEGEEVILESAPDPEREKKREIAVKIWESKKIERSQSAKNWLMNKGKLPEDFLRFIPSKDEDGQLIFPITPLNDVLKKERGNRAVQGVCIRFIDQAGMPRTDDRGLKQRTYGWSSGGVTMLSHPSLKKIEPHMPLIVCEGIADGISLFGLILKNNPFLHQVPILITHGTAGIRKIVVDPTNPLYFFSDRGEAGEYSSWVGARNHAKIGGLTRIYLPKRAYAKDPNEAVVPGEALDDLFEYVVVSQR